jgi:hypothetical protein
VCGSVRASVDVSVTVRVEVLRREWVCNCMGFAGCQKSEDERRRSCGAKDGKCARSASKVARELCELGSGRIMRNIFVVI